jgi:Flp pilus assembly secretin CpaC
MQYFQPYGAIIFSSFMAVSAISSAGAVLADPHAAPISQELAETTMPQVLSLMVDFAGILHIDGEMTAIAVGNPEIADASLADKKTVILTGRTAGLTNIIALDASGAILADVTVRVTSQKPNVVTVRRGTTIETISCAAANCAGPTGEIAVPVEVSSTLETSS